MFRIPRHQCDQSRSKQVLNPAVQVRSLSGFALSETDAIEAARNLMGFMALLSKIDTELQDKGNEDASHRS